MVSKNSYWLRNEVIRFADGTRARSYKTMVLKTRNYKKDYGKPFNFKGEMRR